MERQVFFPGQFWLRFTPYFIQKLFTSYSMERDPFITKQKRMIILIEVTNTHLFIKVENITRIFKMY